MKKNIIITSAMLLLSAIGLATNAAEITDTVFKINKPRAVTITESPEGFSLLVTSESSDTLTTVDYSETFSSPVKVESHRSYTNLQLASSSDDKWNLIMTGPGIGWVNACSQPDNLGIEMGKSLEISWFNALAVQYHLSRCSSLSLGLGFDWRNYRISTSALRFEPTDNSTVATTPYPDGCTGKGSRLKVFSLELDLRYSRTLPLRLFGKKCTAGVGVIANLNTHGSMKTKWIDADGNKFCQKSNHIGQRKFTVDFIAALGVWSGVNIYVRYSPQSVLKGAGQPRFSPLSTGIMLGF